MSWKPKKYRVLRERILRGQTMAKAGDFVYDQAGYDYGLASDDTRMTGVQHTTVTLKEDGGYPGFTIPAADLEAV